MSLKVVDGHVNLSLALIAEYTNEKHEPILSTKEVPVPKVTRSSGRSSIPGVSTSGPAPSGS